MKLLLLIITLLATLFADVSTNSVKTINIGVVSFRPIDENQKIWKPLEIQLKNPTHNLEYNITSYTVQDLEKAVAKNQLDFVVTIPTSYVALESKYGVTNIASLVRHSNIGDEHLSLYAGTIAVLSSRKDITKLEDIRGKTIAATEDGFASMLMQRAVLLDAGIDITNNDAKMLYTGWPLDNTLNALKNHNADVAFFRTGYIEELISKGKLAKDELFIINKIDDGKFPYLRSTPLYPEWAVGATTRSSVDTIKTVATAFLNVKCENSSDYHEFSIPLSYNSIRELMKRFNIYPYEKQNIGLVDTLKHYALYIQSFFILLLLITIISVIKYRKKADDALRSKLQLENILKTSGDGIHIHDLDGRIILCNDAFAKMIGYSIEETKQMCVVDLLVGYNLQELKELWNNLPYTPQQFDSKHIKKDKTIIDVDVLVNKIKLDGKEYICASSRDITASKELEINLLQLQKVARFGHYNVDLTKNKWEASETLSELFGIDKDYEKSFSSWLNLVHHDDKASTKAYMDEVLLNRTSIDKVYRVVRQNDKKTIWVRDFGRVQFDNSGKPLGGFGIIIDITQEKEIETRLKLATSAGNIGIWDLDIANNVLTWDESMFYLYDISPDEYNNTYEAWLSRIHPDDIQEQNRISYESRNNNMPYNTEFRIIHKDGSTHYIKAHAIIVRDDSDKATRMIGTNIDITNSKLLEEAIKKANMSLEARVKEETQKRVEQEKLLIQQSKMAAMGEMISAIAHQWRQPLNALAIKVQDIPVAYEFGEIDKKYTEDFKNKSMSIIRYMSQTIEGFREFFKPNREKEEFLVEHAVSNALNMMLPQLTTHNIQVNLEDNANHIIFGYRSELEQVILILLSNAKDAILDKLNQIPNPTIDISTTINSVNSSIVVSISDNAGGIAHDIIDRIFEPYFTTKEQGKGTGIGLYIAREIIERQMGGKIYATNTEVGASFIVELYEKNGENKIKI